MSASLSAFHQRDGSSTFTCSDCGVTVHHFGPGVDFPICLTCQFIGEHPQLTDEIRQLLRGDIEIVFRATPEELRHGQFNLVVRHKP